MKFKLIFSIFWCTLVVYCNASYPLEAPPEDYTFMAAVGFRVNDLYFFVCGGTIIHEFWVLTAAHCFQKEFYSNYREFPNRYIPVVKVGTHYLPEGKWIDTKVVRVENFSGKTLPKDDIALMKTLEKIVFSPRVTKINLPDDNWQKTIGSNAFGMVAGWGGKPSSGQISPILKYTQLKIISRENCDEEMEKVNMNLYYHHRFCAVGNSTGSCDGDMGAPFVINNTVVGVLSHSSANCDGESPEVFTDVSPYLSWIIGHIDGLLEDPGFIDRRYIKRT